MSATAIPIEVADAIHCKLVTNAAVDACRAAIEAGESDWQASARGVAVVERQYQMTPEAAGDLWEVFFRVCTELRAEAAPVNAGAPL